MGIAEFLDAPDSALLIAIDGDVNLVTTHHETETRTIIDRFPLGPVANVDAVLALLGAHGLLKTPGVTPISTPTPMALPETQQPALPAPKTERSHICPECGKSFSRPGHVERHMRQVHSETTSPTPQRKREYRCPICNYPFRYPSDLKRHEPNCRARTEPPVQCDQCDRTFETPHALRIHKARAHTGSTWSTRRKAKTKPGAPDVPAQAASAAAMPAPAPLPVMPAIDDVASVAVSKQTTSVVADGVCPVCFKPLVSHDECDRCGTFIGPGHPTERPIYVSGLDLCQDCARAHSIARKNELAAQIAAHAS